MSYQVFQTMTFYTPKDEEGNELKPEIITELATVIEKDAKMVEMKAVRALDEKWMDKLEDITIVVHPF